MSFNFVFLLTFLTDDNKSMFLITKTKKLTRS